MRRGLYPPWEDTLYAQRPLPTMEEIHPMRRGLYPPWERYTPYAQRPLPTMGEGTLCA